ncbi:hypothetical protein B0H13DRAFT_1910139 [Mycena leptocephala]|nr:hypothetical protein B0H13DRAFT_1910139 [Mycena leptocephala]
MGRPRTGKPPGRTSDFTGEKKEWLESFYPDLLDAGFGTGGDPGSVYDSITAKWFDRYGYDLPITENVAGDPDAKPPPLLSPVPDEDKKKRRELQKKLRQKLSSWYRTRYRSKKVHGASIKNILSSMQAMSGPSARPRAKPAMIVYSKLHYATRIKPRFDALWASIKDTTPAASRVSMSQDYVRKCWQEESQEVKEEVEKKAHEMHRAAIEEWKAGRKVPEASAESYHQALENLNDVGIPLADSLAERLGAHVIILVVGPVGTEGGEVALRSVFSDTSGGLTQKTWPQFDHAGFTAMEKSITRYGRAFFGKAACAERVWPPLPADSAPLLPDNLLTMDQSPDTPAASTNANALAPPTPITAPLNSPTRHCHPRQPTATTAQNIIPAAVTDGIDREGWSDSLTQAHQYCSAKAWGITWTALVAALVHYEWSNYHHEDRGCLDSTHRPTEIPQWMKKHRVYDDYNVGADFGQQLFTWWKELGPRRRWKELADGEHPARDVKGWEDWGRLNVSGRNGPLLIVVGLAWWGQTIWNEGAVAGLEGGEAALSAATDWRFLVEDVTWALKEVLPRDREGEDKEDKEREENEREQKEVEKSKNGGKKGVKAKAAGKRKWQDEVDANPAPAKQRQPRGREAAQTPIQPAAAAEGTPDPQTASEVQEMVSTVAPIPNDEHSTTSGPGNGGKTGGTTSNDGNSLTAALEHGHVSEDAAGTTISTIPTASPVSIMAPALAGSATSGSTTLIQMPDSVASTSVLRPDVQEDVEMKDQDGEANSLREELELRRLQVIDPTEWDPFTQLTAEELAEIAGDPGTDDDEEDIGDNLSDDGNE